MRTRRTPAQTILPAILMAAALVALVIVYDQYYDVGPILITATVLAWIATALILLHYHLTTRWWESAVGRTTMGIAASVFILCTGGILGRVDLLLGPTAPRGLHDGYVDVTSAGWTLVALAMISRLSVLRTLQRQNRTENEEHHG